jgi:hypothetical protein
MSNLQDEDDKPANEELFQAFQSEGGGVAEILIVRPGEALLLRSIAEEGNRRARIFWKGYRQALDDRTAGKSAKCECVICGAVIGPGEPLGAVIITLPYGAENLQEVHCFSALCCAGCGGLSDAELQARYLAEAEAEPIRVSDEGTA